MKQGLYGLWLGDVFFFFCGESSESLVDIWRKSIRQLKLTKDVHAFEEAKLRLAKLRWPSEYFLPTKKIGKQRVLLGKTLEGVALSPKHTLLLFLNWHKIDWTDTSITPGDEMNYWIKASHFALELLLRGHITTGIETLTATTNNRRNQNKTIRSAWLPYVVSEQDVHRFFELAEAMPAIAFTPIGTYDETKISSLEEASTQILYSFLSGIVHSFVTTEIEHIKSKLKNYYAHYRRGHSPISELWWNSLMMKEGSTLVHGSREEVISFSQNIKKIACSDVPKRKHLVVPTIAGTLRLLLKLQPNWGNSEAPFSLCLSAESEQEVGVSFPILFIWSHRDVDLQRGSICYANVKEQVLMQLGMLSENAPELYQGLSCAYPHTIHLELNELHCFLTRSLPLLRGAGVKVLIPSRFTTTPKTRTGLHLQMINKQTTTSTLDSPGIVGIPDIVSFDATASLHGEPVTIDELTTIVQTDVPYINFRGHWIEVDLQEIKHILKFFKNSLQQTMPVSEWIDLVTQESDLYDWKGLSVLNVKSTGILSSLLSGEIMKTARLHPIPSSFHGQLRDYQIKGYQWLTTMRDLQLGVCLADDMGLGKTVQVIAYILDSVYGDATSTTSIQKQTIFQNKFSDLHNTLQNKQFLIVCPTSLLGNWERELRRFSPSLKVYVHQGHQRLNGKSFLDRVFKHDVVLTTYPLIHRDYRSLEPIFWQSIVLDEAQYIKNPKTKQAQSAMKLRSIHRVAMTGTPIENHLTELWSIFQFLNPGYLGSTHSFKQRYLSLSENTLERSHALHQLHRRVSPFMLRRLKNDPFIIKDLPEKLEVKCYCSLRTEQVKLYEKTVKAFMNELDGLRAFNRKGMILSSLVKLKQICDHPELVCSTSMKSTKPNVSGKLDRLFELLDTIWEYGESALIFTQYVTMGHLLSSAIVERYKQRPFFLHGGIKQAHRDQMVDAYQRGEGCPLFILSLRAGGVGLNLTRANHVIHYDRWWNPAVENQATDRSFRIGQKRNVHVYKLICSGTLEERIDELIENKKQLSEHVIGAGEHWITEMSDEQLRELICLQHKPYDEEE